MKIPTSKDWKNFNDVFAPEGRSLPEHIMGKPRKEETKKRGKPEQELQILICEYLDTQKDVIYWAVPNHLYIGQPTPQKLFYMQQQRRAGLKKGVPDMTIIVHKNGQYRLLCLEVKADKGALSPEQVGCIAALSQAGVISGMVKCLQDVMVFLEKARKSL